MSFETVEVQLAAPFATVEVSVGTASTPQVYCQATQPVSGGKAFLWVQTGLPNGRLMLWIDDGL